MFCMHCGTDIPDQASFCTKCGKPVKIKSHNGLSASSPTAPLTPAIPTIPLGRTENATSAKWIRRVGIPLATLAWIGLVAVMLWAASHVVRSLILLTIAALFAFALAPTVKLLARVMPRFLAILVVYIIVFSAISIILYFLVQTTVHQVSDLRSQVQSLLQPDTSRPPTPLEATLTSLGINQAQIQDARQVVVSHLGGLVNDAAPFLKGLFDFVLDVLVVAMLSIYLLIDGARITRWLRNNMPVQHQVRVHFLLDTLERVVGGYIRGQFTLAVLIGFLVGIGMTALRVPHPVLLGMLAFLLAFIPVLGTFISAAACVLLALTQTHSWVLDLTHQGSWLLAVIVLVYFVLVHLIESHIVGPRIVGDAVGLHPIISIPALIAGAELFGILGALFVAPVVGVIQAIIIALWLEWRAKRPDEFPIEHKETVSEVSEPNITV